MVSNVQNRGPALPLAAALAVLSLLVSFSLFASAVSAAILFASDSTMADFQAGTLEGVEVAAIGDGAVRLTGAGLAGGWNAGSTSGLPPRMQQSSVFAAGRIYVFAGRTASGPYLNTVLSSPIDPATHANGAWVAGPSLPKALSNTAAVTLDGRIYVLGGFDGKDNTDGIYRSNIGANGTLSVWFTEPVALPEPVSGARVVALNGRIYIIGGQVGLGRTSRIWYASVDSASGAVGSWVETAHLPAPFDAGVDGHVAAVLNGTIYVGLGFVRNGTRSEFVYAHVAADGTIANWTQGPSYPASLTGAEAVAYGDADCGGSLLVIGGGGNQFQDARSAVNGAAIVRDYRPGSWVASTDLPDARFLHSSALSADGWVYVIDGGTSYNQTVNSVRYAATACAAVGARRAPAGSFTSRTFDLGAVTPLRTASWTSTRPGFAAESLAFYYRKGNVPDLSSAPWTGPIYSAPGTDQVANVVLSGSAQYFQYRVDLVRSADDQSSPQLNSFRLEYGMEETPTVTLTPSNTATPTITPTPSSTATPSDTATPVNTPTATYTLIVISTSTPTTPPTFTPTALPTETVVSTSTATPEDTATGTPTETAVPTETQTVTPTATATATPSEVPTETATATETASATPTTPPDAINLVVRSISLQPYGTLRPWAGHLAQVAVEVQNVGSGALPAGYHIEVDVYANKEIPPSFSTSSDAYGVTTAALGPGESVIVLVPYVPAATGSSGLYAWVNRPRFVPETSFDDDLAGPVTGCAFDSDGQTFSDVVPTAWPYSYVEYLSCTGVLSGYSDGTFKPNNNTTRGQFAKMITLSMGWPIYTAFGPHFRDVPTNNVFYPFVETAYSHGIISGYDCGSGCLNYRPNNNITRGQLAKIITLARQLPTRSPVVPTFADVPASDPFYSFVETIYAEGIASGYDCGSGCLAFRPGSNATRAQLAKMLYLTMVRTEAVGP